MTETAELPEKITRRQSLLEIAQTIDQLGQEAADATDEEREVIAQEIARMQSVDLPRKADCIGLFDRACDSKVEGLQRIIADASNAIDAILRKQEFVRAVTKQVVSAQPEGRIRGDVYNLSVRKGRDMVRITDAALIPQEWRTIPPPPAPDGRAILYALKEGMEIPGAELVAGEDVLYVSANARGSGKKGRKNGTGVSV